MYFSQTSRWTSGGRLAVLLAAVLSMFAGVLAVGAAPVAAVPPFGPALTHVLNAGGGQNASDGIEWRLDGGQLQVHRYTPAYSSGTCDTTSCVLTPHAAQPGAAQLYDPVVDPAAVSSPQLTNGWFLAIMGDPNDLYTTTLVGQPAFGAIPDATLLPICDWTASPATCVNRAPWRSVVTTGGSVTADQAGSASHSITSVMTYTPAPGQDFVMTVTMTYVGLGQRANVTVSVTAPADNTATMKVYNLFDSYLLGDDSGAGFYDATTDSNHPQVGVQKYLPDGTRVIEAMQNNGPLWDGYVSSEFLCGFVGVSDLDVPVACGGSLSPVAGGAMFLGGDLYTGEAALNRNPTTDNGFGAMWKLPVTGTDPVKPIDYDLNFSIDQVSSGNVFIGGRYWDGSASTDSTDPTSGTAESCSNTPYHSIFAAASTSAANGDGASSAQPGDTVYICPGTYRESRQISYPANVSFVGVNLDGTPATGIQRPVIERAANPDSAGPLFASAKTALPQGTTAFRGLILQNGYSASEPGAMISLGPLDADTMLAVVDCDFLNNTASSGGAISTDGAGVVVTDSVFAGNTATREADFVTSRGGGAILSTNGTVTVNNSSFTANFAQDDGGAISAATVAANDSTFESNRSREGGALASFSAIVRRSSFKANVARGDGGAISTNIGDLADSTFTSNSTEVSENFGGAVAAYGNATGAPTVRHAVTATSDPVVGTTLAIAGSTFSGNSSTLLGGAVYVATGPTTIVGSTFASNSVDRASGGVGGAVYSTDQIAITSSTFVANTAYIGGAVLSAFSPALPCSCSTELASVTAINSTFSANTADTGGAISGWVTAATYSTFADNVADSFGGAINADQGLRLANSLFSTNAVSPACGSPVTGAGPNSSCAQTLNPPVNTGSCSTTSPQLVYDLGGNITDDASCAYQPSSGSPSKPTALSTAVDMHLGVLANNPASAGTQTISIDTTSTAYSAADCTAAPDILTDQNGVSRPRGGGCEAGAFEVFEALAGPGAVYIVGRGFDSTSGVEQPTPDLGHLITSCDNTPYHLIGDATHAAVDGDTVHVCPGTYTEPTIQVSADDVTIEGDMVLDPTSGPQLQAHIDALQDNIDAGPAGHGLIAVAPSVTTFTLDTIELTHGRAVDGGAVYAPGSLVVVKDSAFSGNQASVHGGAVYARDVETSSRTGFSESGIPVAFYANVALAGSEFDAYDAMAGGGAIFATRSVHATDTVFAYNGTTGSGGAIDAPDVEATRTAFGLNSTYEGFGGAIVSPAAFGRVVLVDSAMALNGLGYLTTPLPMQLLSPQQTSVGGGIAAMGAGSTVSLQRTSVFVNFAGTGGGIYSNGGSVQVTNTSFVSNHGDSAGGAIHLGSGTLDILHSSFYSNSSLDGSSVWMPGLRAPSAAGATTSTVTNSIFADVDGDGVALSGTCNAGELADGGGNFTTDGSCPGEPASVEALGLVVPDPLPFGSPNLVPSGIFPGLPFDAVVAPSAGSVAFDAIAPDLAGACAVSVDERGVARPQGAKCDAGAYEHQPASGPNSVYIESDGGSCVAPTYTSITDAVAGAVTDDIIHVCTGTYREPTIVVPASKNNLTILGEDYTPTNKPTTSPKVPLDPSVIIDGEQIEADATSRHQIFDATGLTISFKNVTLRNGSSDSNGGGVTAAEVIGEDCVFRHNVAPGGGAVFVTASLIESIPAAVTMTNCDFTDNGFSPTADTFDGGAIYADGGLVTLTDSRFTGNSAINHTSVDRPVGENGASPANEGAGGAVLAAHIESDGSTFDSNIAAFHGGALLAETVNVRTSTFTANTALVDGSGYGGAIWGSYISVTESTFSANQADGGGAIGAVDGAAPILAPAPADPVLVADVRIDSSTFEGNTATAYGGAVYNTSGTVESYNSTFSANTAGLNGGGVMSAGPLTLLNNTFDANTAVNDGGVYATSAAVTVGNNIFSFEGGSRDRPTPGNGCSDWTVNPTDLGGNFTSDWWCPGTEISVNRMGLKPLADNGGPTETIGLQRWSSAVDHGDDATCQGDDVNGTDQRGVLRPVGAQCDSGAVEFAALTSDPTTTATLASETEIVVGDTISDTATVTPSLQTRPVHGGRLNPAPAPTGMVEWFYCFDAATAPSSCDPSTGTAIGDLVELDVNGEAVLTDWEPTDGVGFYMFHAVYRGDDNWAASFDDGTDESFEVVKRVTVTADDASATYGTAAGPFTYTSDGFDPGDDFTTPPTCSVFDTDDADYLTPLTADATLAPGDYVIHCADGVAPAGYKIKYVDATLTVSKKKLRIEVEHSDITYGDSSTNLNIDIDIEGWARADKPAHDDDGEDHGYMDGFVPPDCDLHYTPTTPVGSVDVTCTGGSSDFYEIPSGVIGSYVIKPAKLTVTADPKTAVYGGPAPTYTYTVTGFRNGETESGGTMASGYVAPTCSSSYSGGPTAPALLDPISASPSGPKITCSGGSATNYTFEYKYALLTLAKAVLVVTPDAKSVVYGGAAPTYTFSVTGFVPGQTAGTAAGYSAPKCTSSYTTSTAVGSPVNITCSGGSATNYSFTTSATAALTVTQAALVVTPDAKSVAYGAVVGAYTFKLSGLKNNEPVPGAGYVAPVCSSSYSTTSPAGTPLTISCSGGSSTNYTFGTSPTAVLTVTKAVLTVTPDAKSVSYGGSVPSYTSVVSGFRPGDSAATAAGYVAPVCVSPYTSFTSVGYVTITCSGGSATNYTFSFQTAKVTVNKAVLVVTPDAKSVVYGGAAPTYTFGVAGFVPGQTAGTAGGYVAPKCTSSYTTSTAAGALVNITCSGGSATNYSFTTT
ncbi:MAG: hypothetical protein F2789_06635, partial [Actinobacteria bacterium]|nr:hypothetical protein [Actinomycetota bacterium]